MSKTINIKDIPGYRVDTVYVDDHYPYLLQFNFPFSFETVIDFHSRDYAEAADDFHVATWKVKQLH